ncbi:uncharacterized protein LOC129222817 isoform X2 [Uloborus diversus]|uniref:uncharacterized protein LOC129222817 isoform X2 n=1 Tax=Uloborus diversus TaxID=327109 RepID=UPI002409BBA7|nr:uncharacterized protein LOC129222817 isoform X2 [Uloborus diversus]
MDTSEILKYIKHFYCNTLSTAYYYPSWSKEDITNAFKSAKLCEQIYQDVKNKTLVANLDELIHSLRIENYESICLEDLKSSSTFLIQALFENPYIENETLENIFYELKNEGTISGDICNLYDLAELDTTCVELIEATKPIKLKNSERSIYFEIKAEMLLDFLCNRFCEQTTEQQICRIESNLFEAFESLCQNEENMAARFFL